jgi:hypothetical protein
VSLTDENNPTTCTVEIQSEEEPSIDADPQRGVGAHWEDIRISGKWTPSIAKLHINRLELLAIHLSLRRLLPRIKGQTVKVRCDNLSVVVYINRQGGTRSKSLSLQTVQLLIWCQRHGISLQAEHIPGVDNKLADALSREGTTLQAPTKVRGTSVEWHLNRVVCQTLFNLLEKPSIDLFARGGNNQLPIYCTWGEDPMAYAVDTMTISWNMTLAYAFPPIAPRVLEKLSSSRNCRMLLIAPMWPRQIWFPRLLSFMIAEPISLPQTEDLLLNPDQTTVPLTTIQSLHLTAWSISSDHILQKDFRRRLPPWLQRQGDLQPGRLIIPASSSTTNGAELNKSVLIKPLWGL